MSTTGNYFTMVVDDLADVHRLYLIDNMLYSNLVVNDPKDSFLWNTGNKPVQLKLGAIKFNKINKQIKYLKKTGPRSKRMHWAPAKEKHKQLMKTHLLLMGYPDF